MIFKPTDIDLIVNSYEHGEQLGFRAGMAMALNDDWIQRAMNEAVQSDHWLNGNTTTASNEGTTQVTQQDVRNAIILAKGEKLTPKLSCLYNWESVPVESVVRLALT
jgi:hypothetical protein